MEGKAERKTSPAGGVLSATGAAIKYVAIPLFLIYLVQKVLPALNMDLSPFITGTVVIGLALIAVGFIHGYYWKGSQQRLAAGLAGVALAIIWIVIIVGGFNLGASFESFSFKLSLNGMYLIIAGGISLKGIYHFAEYGVYKRELEEEDALQRQQAMYQHQYAAAQYQQYPQPTGYPQQTYTPPPPPPPPPEEKADTGHPDAKGNIEFRHYDEMADKEDGEIEWKKPEENWKIESHTEKSEKKKED